MLSLAVTADGARTAQDDGDLFIANEENELDYELPFVMAAWTVVVTVATAVVRDNAIAEIPCRRASVRVDFHRGGRGRAYRTHFKDHPYSYAYIYKTTATDCSELFVLFRRGARRSHRVVRFLVRRGGEGQ